MLYRKLAHWIGSSNFSDELIDGQRELAGHIFYSYAVTAASDRDWDSAGQTLLGCAVFIPSRQCQASSSSKLRLKWHMHEDDGLSHASDNTVESYEYNDLLILISPQILRDAGSYADVSTMTNSIKIWQLIRGGVKKVGWQVCWLTSLFCSSILHFLLDMFARGSP